MSKFFIAVGGTGQHAAMAYLHLARVAGFRPVPIVTIDNDDDGEIAKDLSSLMRTFGLPTSPFIPPFPPRIKEDTPAQLMYREQTLLDLFFESQFSTGTRGSEQGANIKYGFYGFPHLGATFSRPMFEDALSTEPAIAQTNPLHAQVLTKLASSGECRVTICGSLVGGCGSGVIPQLIEILDWYKTTNSINVKIQCTATLLTFVLGAPPTANVQSVGNTANRRILDQAVMRENMISGFHYLYDELFRRSSSAAPPCDRVILLGAPQFGPHQLLRRENQGHQGQKATPDYFHVVAAACQHLFLNAEDAAIEKNPGNNPFRLYSTGPAEGQEANNLLGPDDIPVPGERIIAQALANKVPLPLDDFDTSFSQPLKLSGDKTAGKLLPDCSLHRAFWVARVQMLIAERLSKVFSGFIWRTLLKKDIRHQTTRWEIFNKLPGELARMNDEMNGSLEWIHRAFRDPRDEGGKEWDCRAGVDPDPEKWEMIDRPGSKLLGPAGWHSKDGKRLAQKLHDLKPEEIDLIFPVETNDTADAKSPAAVAAILYQRCRDLAESWV